MKMYGVFAKPKMPANTPTDDAAEAEKAWQAAVAESDKSPIALCRYADTAQKILKEYENGAFEIREVDVPTFEVITRRPVQL
jgi:hypothetical protein